MKIISLPASDKSLVKKAKKQDRMAQKQLFDRYAPKMLSICRQYIKDLHFAEDVMIIGFTKAFSGIKSFDIEKSFGAWIRQIMIHESISFLRKKQIEFKETEDEFLTIENENNISLNDLDTIQFYIDQLPQGYKTVFLLYVVEGYKHHEIAEMLAISEGTSKSQLFKAREILKNNLSPIYDTQNLKYGK